MNRQSKTAYIGLGGNIGNVIEAMTAALVRLNEDPAISVVAVSKVYKTPPWGIEDQDWFFNACAEFSTALTAQQLLDKCLETEKKYGRERDIRWGPRTLDLDVLWFNNETIETETLTIPHPRMQERAFVMKPLSDIAPNLDIHGQTVSTWTDKLDDKGIEEVGKMLW